MMYFGFNTNRMVVTVMMMREVDIKYFPEANMGAVADKDMEEGEVDPQIFLIVERYAMC
jgi:hypothetical protein